MLRHHPLLLALLLLACNDGAPGLVDRGADRPAADGAPPRTEARAGDRLRPDLALPANPEQEGPFAVGLTKGELVEPTYGKFPLYVYYPATTAGNEAAPQRSHAPYPLVVFAHGHGGSGSVNTWVGKQLASWGYVCAFFSAPNPSSTDTGQWAAGLIGTIGNLAERTKSATDLLGGLVDAARVGLVGHSQGGSGALWAASQGSAAIKAVVALAPPGYAFEKDATIKTAVQLQVGSLDGVCPPGASQGHYAALGAPKQLLEIAGGNHIGFLDEGIAFDAAVQLIKLGMLPDKLATISRDEQVRISRRYLTAWFARYLSDQTQYSPYLFGSEAQKDKTSGVLSALSFVE